MFRTVHMHKKCIHNLFTKYKLETCQNIDPKLPGLKEHIFYFDVKLSCKVQMQSVLLVLLHRRGTSVVFKYT